MVLIGPQPGKSREGFFIENRELKQQTSFENKRLGNGDYFVVIASSFHPLLLTEHAANGLVEAPLKYI